ncbi:hypothetical protein JXA40_03925 [bacterium]|nr:hypothetical protein [candidate division CSSED10-310 bacterium]
MNPVWNSMIFFLNRRCSVGCATCNAGCSPDNREILAAGWIGDFFSRGYPAITKPFSVWTGGEPFLSPNALTAGLQLCRKHNIHAEILTSGAWHRNRPDLLAWCAHAGPFTLRISLDAEHQQHVPLDDIEILIDHALALNIPVCFTLRDIPGHQGMTPEEFLDHLREQFPDWTAANIGNSRWIHRIPTIRTKLHPGSIPRTSTRKNRPDPNPEPCRLGFRDLVIGPDGLIYPCCGLFAIPGHRALALGDPLRSGGIIRTGTGNLSPILHKLKTKGPAYLLAQIDPESTRSGYLTENSQCTLCQILLRHPRMQSILSATGRSAAFYHSKPAAGAQPALTSGSRTALTVILPCAGSGERLGLTGPKELFQTASGYPLIRYSLEHIRTAIEASQPIRIAVVIRSGKESVAEYVSRFFPEQEHRICYFNEKYEEWPGSVFSAREVFSGRNLVLLPDSILSLSPTDPFRDPAGTPLCRLVENALHNRPVVFGVIPCRDPDRLRYLGALHFTREMKISAFQDKPRQGYDRFNGFWGCYAFRKSAGEVLYRFLLNSVRQVHSPVCTQPFHPASGILLNDYYDLGTWPSIKWFRNSSLYHQIHFSGDPEAAAG